MNGDVDQIKLKVDFLQGIADLKRRFVPMDVSTFNSISSTTKQRIDELSKTLNEAAQSIGDYALDLSTDIQANKVSRSYALGQAADMIKARDTLDGIVTRLNSQIKRFNDCLEKAENHP
jgi:hypothetical protein